LTLKTLIRKLYIPNRTEICWVQASFIRGTFRASVIVAKDKRASETSKPTVHLLAGRKLTYGSNDLCLVAILRLEASGEINNSSLPSACPDISG